MERQANLKHSYLVMKLDYQLTLHKDIGTVDIEDMYDYIKLFRQLPGYMQDRHAGMVDEMCDMWDSYEQPTD